MRMYMCMYMYMCMCMHMYPNLDPNRALLVCSAEWTAK